MGLEEGPEVGAGGGSSRKKGAESSTGDAYPPTPESAGGDRKCRTRSACRTANCGAESRPEPGVRVRRSNM